MHFTQLFVITEADDAASAMVSSHQSANEIIRQYPNFDYYGHGKAGRSLDKPIIISEKEYTPKFTPDQDEETYPYLLNYLNNEEIIELHISELIKSTEIYKNELLDKIGNLSLIEILNQKELSTKPMMAYHLLELELGYFNGFNHIHHVVAKDGYADLWMKTAEELFHLMKKDPRTSWITILDFHS